MNNNHDNDIPEEEIEDLPVEPSENLFFIIKEDVKLAAPIIFIRAISSIPFLMNGILLARLGDNYQSAVMGANLGVLFSITLHSAPLFLVTPLIAEKHGENKLNDQSDILKNGWVTAGGLSISGIIVMLAFPSLLSRINQSEEVVEICQNYFYSMLGAIPAELFNVVNQGFCLGKQKPFIPLISNIIGLGTYLIIIFGVFSTLSEKAIGMAFSLHSWINVISYYLLFKYNEKNDVSWRYLNLFKCNRFLRKDLLQKFVRAGMPIMGYMFLEFSNLITLGYIISKLGDAPTKIQGIVNQLFDYVTVPILAFMDVTITKVGYAFGINQPTNLKKHAIANFILSAGYASLISIVFLSLSKQLVDLFINENEQQNANSFIQQSKTTMGYATGIFFLNSFRYIAEGGLRGLQVTARPAVYIFLGLACLTLPMAFVWTNKFNGSFNDVNCSFLIGTAVICTLMLMDWFFCKTRRVNMSLNFFNSRQNFEQQGHITQIPNESVAILQT